MAFMVPSSHDALRVPGHNPEWAMNCPKPSACSTDSPIYHINVSP